MHQFQIAMEIRGERGERVLTKTSPHANSVGKYALKLMPKGRENLSFVSIRLREREKEKGSKNKTTGEEKKKERKRA